MRKRTFFKILGFLLVLGLLPSCKTQFLNVRGIAYQSVRAKGNIKTRSDLPLDATIIASYYIGANGQIEVVVQNNTNHIMTIDRTRSFFRNANGNSIPYYDPTVRVNTQSTMTGGSVGASVNLGGIANAAGIGGALGAALGGVNVGGTENKSTTNTNTTYYVDQPQMSIAPHGRASMGRTFLIEGLGLEFLEQAIASSQTDVGNVFTSNHSYAFCNVCISYSVDDGKTFDTLLSDIYANSLFVSKVKRVGQVNEALRNIYIGKQDALVEPWFLLHFSSDSKQWNNKTQLSEIIDYK